MLNNKRISIKTKIFIFVGLFVLLNIIINTVLVNVSINDIYLNLEKRELKKTYNLIDENFDNDKELLDIIYNANNNGVRVKVFDNNYNLTYTIFSDFMNNNSSNFDSLLFRVLKDKNSTIVTYKNYKKNGYDLYLVGRTKTGYTIISTSVESIKRNAKITKIVLLVTSVFSFFILLIISYYISKISSKKINEIKAVTEDIANLNFGKKIKIKSNDELSDLFSNINIMSDKLEDNIKALENANEKLKQDLIDKEKLEEARKKLTANISHEFKTPLTIISGYSQLIKQEVKDKECRNYLDIMINESQRLSDLVHEFLELSRLEDKNVRLDKTTFSMNEEIDKELEKLKVNINDKNIKIEKEYCLNDMVIADQKQIMKVIENLLTNAIKFTKKEKIIKIKTYKDKKYFYLDIFNTGDAIKKQDIDNIFNSYYKDKTSRNKQGTGLGLTIVNAIIKLHGGKCYVNNVENGVCFTICLKEK